VRRPLCSRSRQPLYLGNKLSFLRFETRVAFGQHVLKKRLAAPFFIFA
jgi:hypothetical protein